MGLANIKKKTHHIMNWITPKGIDRKQKSRSFLSTSWDLILEKDLYSSQWGATYTFLIPFELYHEVHMWCLSVLNIFFYQHRRK